MLSNTGMPVGGAGRGKRGRSKLENWRICTIRDKKKDVDLVMGGTGSAVDMSSGVLYSRGGRLATQEGVQKSKHRGYLD